MNQRRFLLAIVLLVIRTAKVEAADVELPPPARHQIDFEREIEPLLAEHCYSCHGSRKQKSGLRLDQKMSALRGGDSGVDLIPGNGAGSRLVRLVSGLEKDVVMPAEGRRLSVEEVGLFRAWVEQGAVWPERQTGTDEAPVFWSLKALVRPDVPQVHEPRWGKVAIDRFVLAKLEQAGLKPSREADRATLIRRVTFDLTGLSPTPEEVQAFVHDQSRDAYEKVVDRLLASKRYGERWARHWLDVVRFAESHGFEMNQPRPNAWPYRDYVIRAFNEDIPYKQFVLEQLAGDTVGVDEATGFLVGGPWDQVKSPDIQLTKQQRSDELNDMVSTTGSAFLGLTVGCARCHNHKFDPISQRDYYSMESVCSGVEHGERDWNSRDRVVNQRQVSAVQADLESIDARLEKFVPIARVDALVGNDAAKHRPAVNPLRNIDRFAPVRARFIKFTIEETAGASQPCIDELEIYAVGPGRTNVALASAGARVNVSSTLPGFAIHKPEHLIDGRYGNDRSWISNEAGRGVAEVELAQPCAVDEVVWARDRRGEFSDRLATAYKVEVAVDTNHWVLVASSADRERYKPDQKSEYGYTTVGVSGDASGELAELLASRDRIRKELDRLSAKAVVYAGKFGKPPEFFRLYRGDPLQPREKVSPGGLSQVEPALTLPEEASDSDRRVALARWICDSRNPLTARVIVNRLWHYHFGQGIVTTPSDFGEMGGRPSHPELLDWLACELQTNGWKLKPIQRMIVLSSAYRQSSALRQEAFHRDAGNRWLWRFSPVRLEAEELRDTILAVSGRLDLRMGGPGFDVFQPNDNYVRVYLPKEDFGPAEWRRMIYQFKPRLQQDGVFGAFDCPDGAQITPKRTSSITSLQALNLMNSGFLQQQSGYFAKRLRTEAGAAPRMQVDRAFALAFGRSPSQLEARESVKLIRNEGLVVFCRALFNANEFMFVY